MKQAQLLLFSFILVACTSRAAQVTVSEDRIIRGGSGVYMVNADGSGKSSERLPWESINQPHWSPDGEWILYDTHYSDNSKLILPRDHGIYIVQSDGTQRKRIADGDYAAGWSPDGTRIAYLAYDTNHSVYTQPSIYILNVECIVQHKECNLQPDYLARGYSPALSPDGKYIAFVGEYVDADDQHGIYVVNTDGTSEPVRLTPPRYDCSSPGWSPDGMKIVFAYYQNSSTEGNIYVMDIDGSNVANLTKDFTGWPGSPQWSPDGNKIAFIAPLPTEVGKVYKSGDAVRYSNAVYVMDTDGTNITRVTLHNDEVIDWFVWYPAQFKATK